MQKIMFNDKYGLTQAVLDGRKTHTRRMIPKEFFTLQWDVRDNTLVYENNDGDLIDIRNSKYSQFKVGEIVAIAQCYYDIFIEDCQRAENGERIRNIPIKNISDTAAWNNKMFVKPTLMHHYIRITDVRIERLQDISDEDCFKEGIKQATFMDDCDEYGNYKTLSQGYYFGDIDYCCTMCSKVFDTPREACADLIDKVSGKGTWARNPYVFVYQFEKID